MNPLDANFGMQDRIRFPQIDDTGALAASARPDANGPTSDASFQDLLQGLVSQVDTLQKDADASIQGLVTGETTNVHDVTVKMEEAGIAFDLMMQVRNKLMEAYQELIKMQG
jgi:flagellar hook-basal body complex protein FliE